MKSTDHIFGFDITAAELQRWKLTGLSANVYFETLLYLVAIEVYVKCWGLTPLRVYGN